MSWLAERPVAPRLQDLYRSLSSQPQRPVYVVGRNKYAASVAGAIAVEAFVDDYTSDVSYLGRPVIRMNALPGDAIVISCVVDAKPVTALRRIGAAGVTDVLDYFTLVRLAPDHFRRVDYSDQNVEDIRENAAEYRWLHGRLADDQSRHVLERLTQFRLNWDVNEMAGFTFNPEGQYFEPFMELAGGEVFVDGGGYDGATSRQFALRCPGYNRIYYFEPSPKMMTLSRQALEGIERVTFITKGLSNVSGTATFDPDADSASRLSETGSLSIDVTALDAEVSEPVTFIKLDVEGAEGLALEGARRQISENRPKLAVAVYHDQRDFRRIPRLGLGMNDQYRIYLRHYTEGPLETIMYFTM